MASIPKLKAYRLNENYSVETDSDEQHTSNDELLPIAIKDLDATKAVPLVGVKLRSDGILIQRSSTKTFKYLAMKTQGTSISNYQTEICICDNMVLGNKNIDVYVQIRYIGSNALAQDKLPSAIDDSNFFRLASDNTEVSLAGSTIYFIKSATASYEGTVASTQSGNGYSISWIESSTIPSGAAVNNYYDANGNELTFWRKASANYFRFNITQQKTAYNSNLQPIDDVAYAQYFYYDKMLSIDVGNRIKKDSDIWYGSSSGFTTDFADFSATGGLMISYQTFSQLDYSSENSPENVGMSFGNIYNGYKNGITSKQGNYYFKKSIFPLRIQKQLVENGSCTFNANVNWYFDGDFKPILMQRRQAKDGSYYFVQLKQNVQVNNYNQSRSGLTYNVRLLSDFYRKGSEYLYPSELFMIYSEVGDRLDDVFDFDYNADNGLLKYSNNSYFNTKFQGAYKTIYELKQILAVQQQYGYDDTKHLLLNVNGNTATINFAGKAWNNVRIFVNAVKIFEQGVTTEGTPNEGYTVTYSSGTITIVADSANGFEIPKDLMIAYYVPHTIVNYSGTTANDTFYGFRVVCHEKVKKTDLFVSSYPNWVKNHMLNNVDVFVGYERYSGTDTSSTASTGLYPCYQKDGFDVDHESGTITFAEEIEQFDYNDVMNFGELTDATLNSLTEATAKEYETLVIANYAYYNGIINVLRARLSLYSIQGAKYSYALLTDTYFEDAIGKRVVGRQDDDIRLMYESGSVQLPKIRKSNQNQKETCSIWHQLNYNGASYPGVVGGEKVYASTKDDRVSAINYIHSNANNQNLIVYLNPQYVGETTIIDPGSEPNGAIPIYLNWKTVWVKKHDTDTNSYIVTNDEDEEAKLIPCLVIGTTLDGQGNITNPTPMPQLDDIIIEKDVNIQSSTFQKDIFSCIPQYKYTKQEWNYTVYFELISARYLGDNSDTKYIEFCVYKVDK